jgi:hypothetical protein
MRRMSRFCICGPLISALCRFLISLYSAIVFEGSLHILHGVGFGVSSIILVSRRMWFMEVDISYACTGWALPLVIFSPAVSTSHRFFIGPHQVGAFLASVASLLFKLVSFDAPDIPLFSDHSVVGQPLGRFRRIKPYSQRGRHAQ